MAPAAPGRGGVIHVVVRAESEDDQQYEWRDKLAMTDQVQRLAESWARAHGVPGTAVGFDDEKGQEVALDATPSSLGWMPGQEVELKAFPTEDRFMEQEMEALPPDPGASAEEGRQFAGIGAAAVCPPPVEDTLARSTAALGAKDASAKSAASKVPSPAKAASTPPPSAGATGSASSARASAMEAKASARGRGSASGAAQPEAAKQARGRGRGGGGGGGGGSAAPPPAPAPAPPADAGSIPGDTEEIVFEQVNPKKEGGLAFVRYEKYKRARSVAEALNLGACKGDIAHDFKRGFLKRRKES